MGSNSNTKVQVVTHTTVVTRQRGISFVPPWWEGPDSNSNTKLQVDSPQLDHGISLVPSFLGGDG